MTNLFERIVRSAAKPDTGRPAKEKVIEGDPVHTTWNIEERDGLYCGIWQSTPGTWKISYDEWEYCTILEGYSIVTQEGGQSHHIKAGDSFVLRPGFVGTWQVIETTTKDYVIRL